MNVCVAGAPGEHVWVFKAVKEGSGQVCAAYRRPWLPVSSTEPGDQYCVTIEVTH